MYAAILLVCAATHADAPLRVRATELAPPADVSAPLRAVLSPTSYAVSDAKGEFAHFWIRATMPTTADSQPIPYGAIEEGSFVGVLRIATDAMADFRGQKLKPGVYTLRLGLQPQDGNHMGVALYPEFLCLAPAKNDEKIDPLAHDDLMELSKGAAGAGHPTVLFMNPFFEKPTIKFPLVNQNEQKHVVLNLTTRATMGDKTETDMPMGIILIGKTDAE